MRRAIAPVWRRPQVLPFILARVCVTALLGLSQSKEDRKLIRVAHYFLRGGAGMLDGATLRVRGRHRYRFEDRGLTACAQSTAEALKAPKEAGAKLYGRRMQALLSLATLARRVSRALRTPVMHSGWAHCPRYPPFRQKPVIWRKRWATACRSSGTCPCRRGCGKTRRSASTASMPSF